MKNHLASISCQAIVGGIYRETYEHNGYVEKMESYLHSGHYDLISPDGCITKVLSSSETEKDVLVEIHKISPAFVGFQLPVNQVPFNLKSTLAQLGIHAKCEEISLDPKHLRATAHIRLFAIGEEGKYLLKQIREKTYIGKLFADDDRRKVRTPEYLSRMFGRSDQHGSPLLSLGGLTGSDDLILEKVDGRTVAYLSLRSGVVEYSSHVMGLIETISKALVAGQSVRELIPLYQKWVEGGHRIVQPDQMLLVKTLPLHIRTVFARVANDLLVEGYEHTSANILQPDTNHSGDIYELFGASAREITDIPLEFYTLEPHREHVFFEDRDQLQSSIESEQALFDAFETAPEPATDKVAVFVVKGTQLLSLENKDWICRRPLLQEMPGLKQLQRQAQMVERYIQQQPSYPFLKAIEEELITSQGILLCRYLPSPLLKRLLLSTHVQRCLKGIYFQKASLSGDHFFSQEDRAFFNDLYRFGIPTYWVDEVTGKVLTYVQKSHLESGMFVPADKVDTYLDATVFGIYGSNLLEGEFEQELTALLEGILEMKETFDHPFINPQKPLALITGGGPGAMMTGNRVAQNLNILSCANIVDFRPEGSEEMVVNEQRANPYIEAKMTYRLQQLVERQAEFNLDFPIFLKGGIGSDFELSLEGVRRKVGATGATPIILFGEVEYWRQKITAPFQCNLKAGTIKGSEWVSNCLLVVQNAKQALSVYERYFKGELNLGKDGPIYEEGFCAVDELVGNSN